MQLELTDDELSLLREVLASELGELKEQIYKAEDVDYKQLLKRREQLVLSLIQKVGS